MDKLTVLFLCTGNSCRSQMAEGWARALRGDAIEAHSAGVEVHGLNPLAVRVMAEAGVDISRQVSKHLDSVRHLKFDLVITVCDDASESCPLFPEEKKRRHCAFADPPLLARQVAAAGGGEEAQLECYRRVRDEIRAFIETMPEGL